MIAFLQEQGLRVITPDLIRYGQTDKPRGSAAAQRFALHHPSLVSHIAVIAVPFMGPTRKYLTVEQVVTIMPNFTYKLSFGDSAKTENRVKTKEEVSKFMRGVLRPVNAAQKAAQDAGEVIQLSGMNKGDVVDFFGDKPRSDMVTELNLEYYVDQFTVGGLHGPCNWYRTRRQNYEDEKDLPSDQFQVPALFIEATYDTVLSPTLMVGQEKVLPNLTY